MQTSKTVPTWAVTLVKQVCKDYHRALPRELQWYKVKRKSSSGYTWYARKKIHISAGENEVEHRIVLLHELAHHIRNKRGSQEGHTIRFWRLVFELNPRYGVPLKEAYEREVESYTFHPAYYRAKARQAYREIEKSPH